MVYRQGCGDLSYPKGSSVNDGIPQHYGSLSYQTLDDAIALIAKHGRYTILRKRDLKAAFRRIPVSFYHWLLLFEWDGILYVDMCLLFGLCTSTFIFNLFAEELHWILVFEQSLVHYLDDFLLAGGNSKTLFNGVCSFLGLEEKTSKAMDGYVVDFTGIELDTDKMEARLPRDKHDRASLAVQRLLQGGSSSYNDLQNTLGFLLFCTRVIPLAGRSYETYSLSCNCCPTSTHTPSAGYRPKPPSIFIGGQCFFPTGLENGQNRIH
jgi:hypothetical protein